jgi:hypothetical protein
MLGFKLPENDSKYEWTNHVKDKMVYYGISVSLIKRVVRFPERKEEGIAPGTLAAMQPAGSQKRPQEIWVMYKDVSQKSKVKSQKMLGLNSPKMRIISAWRYPGVSPVGKPIPIPEEILQELENVL